MSSHMYSTESFDAKSLERAYRFFDRQHLEDGFLDTRVHFYGFSDVFVNYFHISRLEEPVSCIYTCDSFKDWNKLVHLPMVREMDGVRVFPALGLGPIYATELPQKWETDLKCNLTINPHMCIGEIGLDLSETGQDIPLEKQKELFVRQLQIARVFDWAVLLTAKEAVPELIEVLTENQTKLPRMVLSASDVSVELLPQLNAFAELSYSFSPDIAKRGSKEAQILSQVPTERILLESKNQGAEQNSSDIPHVATVIAKKLRIKQDEMQAILLKNSQRFLGD